MTRRHICTILAFALALLTSQSAETAAAPQGKTGEYCAQNAGRGGMTAEQAKSRAIEYAKNRALPVVDFRVESQLVADVWYVTFLPPIDGGGASYKMELRHPTGELIRVILEE